MVKKPSGEFPSADIGSGFIWFFKNTPKHYIFFSFCKCVLVVQLANKWHLFNSVGVAFELHNLFLEIEMLKTPRDFPCSLAQAYKNTELSKNSMKILFVDLECMLAVECVLCVHKALGLITSTIERKKQKNKIRMKGRVFLFVKTSYKVLMEI